MKLYIKNMVCVRCKMIVSSELSRLGYHVNHVEIGEADILEDLSTHELDQINEALQKFELELIRDKKDLMVEKIKKTILEMIRDCDEKPKMSHSDYICSCLKHNYAYLSNLFSESTGITIERYIIELKIEKVKELLNCDQLSLSEIAFKLGYSSVAHLSHQFKQITGLTPSLFKQLKSPSTKNIGST